MLELMVFLEQLYTWYVLITIKLQWYWLHSWRVSQDSVSLNVYVQITEVRMWMCGGTCSMPTPTSQMSSLAVWHTMNACGGMSTGALVASLRKYFAVWRVMVSLTLWMKFHISASHQQAFAWVSGELEQSWTVNWRSPYSLSIVHWRVSFWAKCTCVTQHKWWFSISIT